MVSGNIFLLSACVLAAFVRWLYILLEYTLPSTPPPPPPLYAELNKWFFYLLQESFHPVEVTEGVWIVPEWRSPPVWLSQIIFFAGFTWIIACHIDISFTHASMKPKIWFMHVPCTHSSRVEYLLAFTWNLCFHFMRLVRWQHIKVQVIAQIISSLFTRPANLIFTMKKESCFGSNGMDIINFLSPNRMFKQQI